ncbi:hypothetical protein L9F63_017831 [Diploptera punctata]|uniref:C-type lectin domain-containing protein n=1 Tax=Diploptera punctata TaxID=6984 RepID=A0AAD7ZY99_DIPPU|nr:hypothetical protein L9F63_017831 [Diploptera punctata]
MLVSSKGSITGFISRSEMLSRLKIILSSLMVLLVARLVTSLSNFQIENSSPYKQFPGLGFYTFYNMSVTWGEAWEQCRSDGGHLLIINSKQELKVATDLIKKNTEAYYTYIGVHDLLKQNHFITVKDEDFQSSQYNRLSSNQRITLENVENCMALTSSGFLHHLNCKQRYPFICELEQTAGIQ